MRALLDKKGGSPQEIVRALGLVMKKTRVKADAGEVHRLVKETVDNA
jgi:Asp-tRNA(Asn)/Glu-tRNA(Gln) amidotransferase B subunit